MAQSWSNLAWLVEEIYSLKRLHFFSDTATDVQFASVNQKILPPVGKRLSQWSDDLWSPTEFEMAGSGIKSLTPRWRNDWEQHGAESEQGAWLTPQPNIVWLLLPLNTAPWPWQRSSWRNTRSNTHCSPEKLCYSYSGRDEKGRGHTKQNQKNNTFLK